MSADRDIAEQTIRTFLARANKSSEISPETPLFANGIGLDSLETAELSSMLEDDLGKDPFSEGLLPQTVREILDFYHPEAVSQT